MVFLQLFPQSPTSLPHLILWLVSNLASVARCLASPRQWSHGEKTDSNWRTQIMVSESLLSIVAWHQALRYQRGGQSSMESTSVSLQTLPVVWCGNLALSYQVGHVYCIVLMLLMKGEYQWPLYPPSLPLSLSLTHTHTTHTHTHTFTHSLSYSVSPVENHRNQST